MDLVVVDKSRFKDSIKAYFLWKELDSIIRNSHSRGINIPETITEALLCYVTGFKLNKGSGGDAYDDVNEKVIEIKATSNFDRDTTSFSPKEQFDSLHFVPVFPTSRSVLTFRYRPMTGINMGQIQHRSPLLQDLSKMLHLQG